MADHVVVIGGGLIGAVSAYRLSEMGLAVTVLDAAQPGNAASGATFGWINASFYLDEEHFALRLESIAAWHRLEQALPNLGVSWPGCLWWEETGAACDAMEATLTRLGYPVERWDRARLERAIPVLAQAPQAALYFPAEGVVEGGPAARRLLAAAKAKGARVLAGCRVHGIETQGGKVSGVRVEGGTIAADRVLVAAGTGSAALLKPLGYDLPLLNRPAVTMRSRPVAPCLPAVVVPPGMEIRQDAQGRIVAPTSPNHQADESDALSEAPEALAERALDRLRGFFPSLKLEWEEATVGFRPMPGDGYPVVGAVGPEGVYLAVMHSGVTLAALMGELISGEIAGTLSPWLDRYRPARDWRAPRGIG